MHAYICICLPKYIYTHLRYLSFPPFFTILLLVSYPTYRRTTKPVSIYMCEWKMSWDIYAWLREWLSIYTVVAVQESIYSEAKQEKKEEWNKREIERKTEKLGKLQRNRYLCARVWCDWLKSWFQYTSTPKSGSIVPWLYCIFSHSEISYSRGFSLNQGFPRKSCALFHFLFVSKFDFWILSEWNSITADHSLKKKSRDYTRRRMYTRQTELSMMLGHASKLLSSSSLPSSFGWSM